MFKNQNQEKMKKIQLVLIATLVIAIAAVLVINPSKAVSQQKINQTSYALPDSVAVVLRNSCASCHGDGGSGMAMSSWNFNQWDNYTAVKQAKKANAICNAMTKGSMPPGSFKKENPNKVPTTAQIGIVCKWAGSLNKK
jgi:mono/diheme cytochrome c family protein